MTVKKVKILAATFLILVSALSFNMVAFAEPVEDDFIIEIDTTAEKTTAPTTTKPTTAAPTTTKPTTTRPTTTRNNTPVYTPVTQTQTTQEDKSFTIKLELNNEQEAIEAKVDADGKVEVPSAPEKEGFKFAGWYSDAEFTKRWDFLESVADEDTVLYAKWEDEVDDTLYAIAVSTNLGGKITVKPEEAKEGETVTIKVTADEGKQMVENSLSVNGKFIEELTFVMPAEDVIVEAQFEDIIVDAQSNNKGVSDNLGKIVTIAAIALVVVIIIVWLIVNRYRFLPEDEEDELFFVEPLSTNQAPIRHDDFVRNKRNQRKNDEGSVQNNDMPDDIMNEAEIRTITKTGNINLDQ